MDERKTKYHSNWNLNEKDACEIPWWLNMWPWPWSKKKFYKQKKKIWNNCCDPTDVGDQFFHQISKKAVFHVRWSYVIESQMNAPECAPNFNPLHARFFRGSIKHIFTFHVILPHWYDTGGWNPSSNKTRTYPFYIVNIMGSLRHQDISSYDIDIVKPRCPRILRVNTCNIWV